MDIFFGTHLILWCLAKVSTTVHPACQPSVHFSGSFHIQPARCVFLWSFSIPLYPTFLQPQAAAAAVARSPSDSCTGQWCCCICCPLLFAAFDRRICTCTTSSKSSLCERQFRFSPFKDVRSSCSMCAGMFKFVAVHIQIPCVYGHQRHLAGRWLRLWQFWIFGRRICVARSVIVDVLVHVCLKLAALTSGSWARKPRSWWINGANSAQKTAIFD